MGRLSGHSKGAWPVIDVIPCWERSVIGVVTKGARTKVAVRKVPNNSFSFDLPLFVAHCSLGWTGHRCGHALIPILS